MHNSILWFPFIYKLFTLLIDLIIVYMGYRLFVFKNSGRAGDLELVLGSRSLRLTHATAGVFFVIFGVFAICLTEWKGFSGSVDLNNSDIFQPILP